MFAVKDSLRKFYMRHEDNFKLHFDLQKLKQSLSPEKCRTLIRHCIYWKKSYAWNILTNACSNNC